MNERMQRILADLKARQDAGEHMACPRCGCDTMKPTIYTNALSRQADIMVCDDCGMSEAKLAFMGNPMPLTQWACFKPRRPDGDFKAVTGEEAWREIQETQLDYLKDVFMAWINGDTEKVVTVRSLQRWNAVCAERRMHGVKQGKMALTALTINAGRLPE